MAVLAPPLRIRLKSRAAGFDGGVGSSLCLIIDIMSTNDTRKIRLRAVTTTAVSASGPRRSSI